MVAAKNSRKRRAAWSPALAMTRGTTISAAFATETPVGLGLEAGPFNALYILLRR
jgi:hypothetical protein